MSTMANVKKKRVYDSNGRVLCSQLVSMKSTTKILWKEAYKKALYIGT